MSSNLVSEAVQRIQRPDLPKLACTMEDQEYLMKQKEEQEKSGPPPSPPRRRNIDDCIADFNNKKFNELPRFSESSADCLVFIDPPPKAELERDERRDKAVDDHYGQPFLISSKKIRALNSPYLSKRLNPSQQQAILKKRGLRIDQFPRGIKYVLDLTPKTEGEEAVAYLMELSCPIGVRLWAMSIDRWEVAPRLAGGLDEFTQLSEKGVDQPEFEESSPPAQSAVKTALTPYQMPPEYTALRHRASIERIFLAALGIDPQLDSAPKLYSAVMVAKGLDINTNPLTDYVARWLRADPNTRFMEALPEVSLKIADGLKCEPVCKDAFAVLVGEAALDAAIHNRNDIPYQSGYTVHGRRCDDLHESWHTRLQYARNCLVDRVKSCFQDLVGEKMSWVEELATWKQLKPSYLCSDTFSQARQELLSTLKDYIRGSIYLLVSSEYDNMDNPFFVDKPGGEKLFPRRKFKETWNRLYHQERIFTRSFWQVLGNCSLPKFATEDYTNMDVTIWHPKRSMSLISSNESRDLLECGVYKSVSLRELQTKVTSCHKASRPLSGIPALVSRFSLLASEPVASTKVPEEEENSNKRRRYEDSNGRVTALPIRTIATEEKSWATSTNNGPYNRASQSFHHATNTAPNLQVRNDVTDYVLPTDGLFDEEPIPDASKRSQDPPPYRHWSSREVQATQFINLVNALNEAEQYLGEVARDMLAAPQGGQLGDTIETNLIDVLLCLKDTETRYLPLWAGGFDDGSGGVFGEFIPPPIDSFNGPTIWSRGSRSNASSSGFDSFADSSTVGTSTVANDGFSDTIDRRRVVAVDDIESQSWSDVGSNDGAAPSTIARGGNESISDDFSEIDIPTPTGNDQSVDLDMSEMNDKLNKGKAIASSPEIESYDYDASPDIENYDEIFTNDDEDDNNDFDNFDDADFDAADTNVEMEESYHGFDADDDTVSTAAAASQSTAAAASSSKNAGKRGVVEDDGTGKPALKKMDYGIGNALNISDANTWIVYKEPRDADEDEDDGL